MNVNNMKKQFWSRHGTNIGLWVYVVGVLIFLTGLFAFHDLDMGWIGLVIQSVGLAIRIYGWLTQKDNKDDKTGLS